MKSLFSRPPNVGKLTRKGDVDGLVAALSYEDVIVDRGGRSIDLGVGPREAAVGALADIDSPEALEALLGVLGDPHPRVRIAAVRGLRRRGGARAADALAAVVAYWPDPALAPARGEALEALEQMRDPDLACRVAAGMVARDAELDETDAHALHRVTATAEARAAVVRDLLERVHTDAEAERARTLLVWLGAQSVDQLITALGEDPERPDVIVALGSARDARAVRPLCDILLGAHPVPVRAASARALGEIRDPSAVEALLVATADSDYEVRSAASESFDKFGNAGIAFAMRVLVSPALEEGAPAPNGSHPVPVEIDRGPGSAAPVLRRLLGRRSGV